MNKKQITAKIINAAEAYKKGHLNKDGLKIDIEFYLDKLRLDSEDDSKSAQISADYDTRRFKPNSYDD